jgi:hypothetical protein
LTIKNLSTLIPQEQGQDADLTKLLKKLRGKSFADFWNIIGPPVKPSTNEAKPIFPYEDELVDTLSRK